MRRRPSSNEATTVGAERVCTMVFVISSDTTSWASRTTVSEQGIDLSHSPSA
jgi:hypothetical protein